MNWHTIDDDVDDDVKKKLKLIEQNQVCLSSNDEQDFDNDDEFDDHIENDLSPGLKDRAPVENQMQQNESEGQTEDMDDDEDDVSSDLSYYLDNMHNQEAIQDDSLCYDLIDQKL